MKIKLIKLIICIFAITFAITGCSKDEDVVSSSTLASNKLDILTFSTIAEFNETLQKVNSMTPENRIAWENEQGFKSFGTICDDYYYSLNPTDYKTIEQLKNSTNQDLLNVFAEEGETFVEPKGVRSIERFIMNFDKMCVIGSNVYKFYDEGTIRTRIDNLEKIRQINDYNTAKIVLNQNVGMYKITKYDENTNKIKMIRNFSTNNNYMLRLHAAVYTYWAEIPYGGVNREIFCIIQNYHRFGIYWIEAHSTNINVSIEATDDYSNVNQSLNWVELKSIGDESKNDIHMFNYGYTTNYDNCYFTKFSASINNQRTNNDKCSISISE
jgi:hypothetical protein